MVTLVTYAFLHGDFWHLAGNMIFLWVLADNVEDALGHGRFLIFYLLCAIAGGYAYVLTDPASAAPVIGASGAIAGCISAYLLLHPKAKMWVLVFARIPIRLSALYVLGFWIVVQTASALQRRRQRNRLVVAHRRAAGGGGAGRRIEAAGRQAVRPRLGGDPDSAGRHAWLPGRG